MKAGTLGALTLVRSGWIGWAVATDPKTNVPFGGGFHGTL